MAGAGATSFAGQFLNYFCVIVLCDCYYCSSELSTFVYMCKCFCLGGKREEDGGENAGTPLEKEKTTDTRSNLLMEIQSGIKLKKVCASIGHGSFFFKTKSNLAFFLCSSGNDYGCFVQVQRQEEAAAERAATEANDVAAILKRRMERVMGADDESQSSGN